METQIENKKKWLEAIDEVERVWTDVLGAIRSNLLVMLNPLAAILAPETETKICQQIIENIATEK